MSVCLWETRARAHPSRATKQYCQIFIVLTCKNVSVHTRIYAPMGNMMGILLNLQTSNTFATLIKSNIVIRTHSRTQPYKMSVGIIVN